MQYAGVLGRLLSGGPRHPFIFLYAGAWGNLLVDPITHLLLSFMRLPLQPFFYYIIYFSAVEP
jgi:hypothetical protein